jgi:hypothetical protein
MKFRQVCLKEKAILVFYFYLFGNVETNSSLYTMNLFLRLITGIKERNMEVLAGL